MDLSALAAVTNKVVSEISSRCLHMRKMKLRSCIYLGDEGVCTVSKLSKLELLDLSNCILVLILHCLNNVFQAMGHEAVVL